VSATDVLASPERRRAAVKEIEDRIVLLNSMIDVQHALNDAFALREIERLAVERDKLINTLKWVGE
jgi:hypothetical protein